MCSVCMVYPSTYSTTERKFPSVFLVLDLSLLLFFLHKLSFRFANNTNNNRGNPNPAAEWRTCRCRRSSSKPARSAPPPPNPPSTRYAICRPFCLFLILVLYASFFGVQEVVKKGFTFFRWKQWWNYSPKSINLFFFAFLFRFLSQLPLWNVVKCFSSLHPQFLFCLPHVAAPLSFL